MGNVRRIYVEKKEPYAVKAKEHFRKKSGTIQFGIKVERS